MLKYFKRLILAIRVAIHRNHIPDPCFYLLAFGVCFLTKFYKSSQRSRANESTGVSYANRARDITTTSMMRGPVVITGGATG